MARLLCEPMGKEGKWVGLGLGSGWVCWAIGHELHSIDIETPMTVESS